MMVKTTRSGRRGFTLVELLTVITIIGMLAGISLGALYSARESAREAKTRATIAKLDMIVQARYDEFASRRVPIDSRVLSTPSGKRLPPNVYVKFMSEARLRALRCLMKWEMPDHLEDIANPKVAASPFQPADIDAPWSWSQTSGGETWTISMKRTALARAMYRRCANGIPTPDYDTEEVFYMWVTLGDPEAIDRFQETEIGDTDGDGYPEFLDGWGQPIKFIRWPSGFVSESDLMTGDAENDHDPFDPRRVDANAFRLVPLIYSRGPDKKAGLVVPTGAYDYDTIFTCMSGRPVNASDPEYPTEYQTHYDNIHNHRLETN